MILGVIADDFTGATDIASMLVRGGMRTIQVIGVPQGPLPPADAVVIALKSRTTPAAEAIAESLAALACLRKHGAKQIFFKYCSTFDSTAAGNIGPVAEALLAALGSDLSIACPAFPENGRTIYRGHLFVGDQLLSDSGMRQHPLTPMTESNLVKVLQQQSSGQVGLLPYSTVAQGVAAIQAGYQQLRHNGVRLAIVDAISDQDLQDIANASVDLPLLTGGSGIALGLPAAYAAKGWLRPSANADQLDPLTGPAAVLSGSCSLATNAQVQHWLTAGRPAFRIQPQALAADAAVAAQALAWASTQTQAVLIYATTSPAEVQAIQAELGVAAAGELVERCLAEIAIGLVAAGIQRLVVAGGETSGAVVQALQVNQLRIGAAIAPGVPWTQAADRPLLLALKSGNFGTVDFFSHALQLTE
ncbi:four-carbon acid sugar kinase family protein [Neisseriaceae bacterium TC5R-5]|nr:four-carbon acid sugar kinase family protein [Neisseriaceae bacterium TC5R-5]